MRNLNEKKILSLLFVCLMIIDCRPKFNDTKAADVIRKSFELNEVGSLEIIGISMETKEIAIVKFKINEAQLSSKMRRYDTGWQLDKIQDELGNWVPAEKVISLFRQKTVAYILYHIHCSSFKEVYKKLDTHSFTGVLIF